MALFADIDAQGWAVIIAAVCVGVVGIMTAIGSIIVSVVTLVLQSRREEAKIERDRQAALEVRKVAMALETNTARTDDKLDTIHDLCNSAMLEQKRIMAVKCRAAADENPTAVNLAEAKAAEEAYDTHAKKQAEMEEAKAKKPAAPALIATPTGPITSAELKRDIAAVPEKVADERDRREAKP